MRSRNLLQTIAFAIALTGSSLFAAACDDDGAAEQAAENVEDAAEDAADKVEDALD